LQLEVRKISKFERLKGEDVIVSPQFNENILSFAAPYGLALQGLKRAKLQTNLLPHDIRVERMVRGKKPWAAAAAAAMLVAVAGLSFGKNMEKAAVTNPEIKREFDALESVKREIGAKESEYKEAEAKVEKSKESLKRLVAGADDRFNWQLMAQFINMTLPQPDSGRLAKETLGRFKVFDTYFNNDAREAFKKLEARRTPSKSDRPKVDPIQSAKDDEYIKKHLVQINVEGIHALFCDDVGGYLKNIFKEAQALKGMSDEEKKIVKTASEKSIAELSDEQKKKVPEKAWVVEIRGYTYHQGGDEFIKNTIVENLRYPEMVNKDIFKHAYARRTSNNDKVPMDAREKMFKEQILDQISFLFLFKSETVENPEPGNFEHIKSSFLAELLKPPLAMERVGGPQAIPPQPDAPPLGQAAEKPKIIRDTWRPLGDIAAQAHGGAGMQNDRRGVPRGPGPFAPKQREVKDKQLLPGANVDKQPRREFVILFLWKEPLRSLEAAVETKKE
jgi:type IV pilus assembly protein PilM